jgi:hypothetical protein
MKSYGSFCPICGKRNEGLMLEETDGWMECIYLLFAGEGQAGKPGKIFFQKPAKDSKNGLVASSSPT